MGEKPYYSALYPILILLAWSILYLPGLGMIDYVHEEGRRALSAREMLEHGNVLLPTVFQKPYLNKPPGISWIYVGFYGIFGEITPWVTRFCSTVATLLTALLIYGFERKLLNPWIRFIASMLFLVTFMSIEKGRLGEIEAWLATSVWAMLVCWWNGYRSGKAYWWWLCGLSTTLAVFLKGPPALLFFYGTLIPFCYYQKKLSWFTTRHHAVAIGLPLVFAFTWIGALVWKLGGMELWRTWTFELWQPSGGDWQSYFDRRQKFLTGSIAGLMPGSLLCMAYFFRHRWREDDETIPLQLYLFCFILSALLLFLYFPGARSRYAYPLTPAIAILAALVWNAWQVKPERNFLSRFVNPLHVLIALAGLIIGGWALFFFHATTYFHISFRILGATCLITTAILAFGWKTYSRSSVITIQLLLLALVMSIGTRTYTEQKSKKYHVEEYADILNDFVPPGETVYPLTWTEFNLYYYLDCPVKYVDSWDEIPRDKQPVYVTWKYNQNPKFPPNLVVEEFRIVPFDDFTYHIAAKMRFLDKNRE